MYHVHFSGTHYEMGFRWGSSLAKRGNFILNNVPFPITQEREQFAAACLPIYQKYFPELLEEIRGLANGQRCDAGAIQTVLFSMYAIPPACGCSCFAAADGNVILLGRNSDFLTASEQWNMNVIYHFSDRSHPFTGNTTAFLEIEDGVNDCGLAVGLTFVYPAAIKPGFNAGLLLRFFLEKCSTTTEVIHAIRNLPVGSAQTITVADCTGEIVLIECHSDGLEVIRPSKEQPFVSAVNLFHSEAMHSFQTLIIDTGNWQSETRYHTLTQALHQWRGQFDVQKAQGLLAGKNGFLCQYDKTSGMDTVWSVVYDLGDRAIYRAEGNPGRCSFKKDKRFSFSAGL